MDVLNLLVNDICLWNLIYFKYKTSLHKNDGLFDYVNVLIEADRKKFLDSLTFSLSNFLGSYDNCKNFIERGMITRSIWIRNMRSIEYVLEAHYKIFNENMQLIEEFGDQTSERLKDIVEIKIKETNGYLEFEIIKTLYMLV